jgi:hypothetical protein
MKIQAIYGSTDRSLAVKISGGILFFTDFIKIRKAQAPATTFQNRIVKSGTFNQQKKTYN